MLGWLRRALAAEPKPETGRVSARRGLPLERRRAVRLYLARVRLLVNRAVTVRTRWMAELSKVYSTISQVPEGLVLERVGAIAARYVDDFREMRGVAEAMTPPDELEPVHDALTAWLQATQDACNDLIDARTLGDRTVLRAFRRHLGDARRHAATFQTAVALQSTLLRIGTTTPRRATVRRSSLRAAA